MKQDSDKVVKSVDGNYYVEIVGKFHKNACSNAYDFSNVNREEVITLSIA